MENELEKHDNTENKPVQQATEPTENKADSSETENWQNILREFSNPDTDKQAQSGSETMSSTTQATVQTDLKPNNDVETVNFTEFTNATASYVVKPYRKKKTGLVVLIVILVLAALAGVGYYLYTQDFLPFAPKKADYEKAERAFISGILDDADELQQVKEKFNTVESKTIIKPSDELAKQLGADKLNESVIVAKTSISDGKASIDFSYSNASNKMLYGSFYSSDNNSFIHAPQISDKYIKLFGDSDIPSFNPAQKLFDSIEKIDKSRIDASIAEVLNKYFASLGKVSEYTDKAVTIGTLEQKYKCADVEITDLVAADTAIAVLNQLLTYPEITDLSLTDFYDDALSEQLEGENTPLGEQIQNIIDTLTEYKNTHTTPSTEKIIMTVYLNSKNEIVGREIVTPNNIMIKYMTINSGSDSAIDLAITNATDLTTFKITNISKNTNGTYTGECSLGYLNSVMDFSIDVEYEDIKEDNGFVTGKMTITVPQMSTTVTITLDALVNSNQYIDIDINAMGFNMGTISTDIKMSNEEVTIPEINNSNSAGIEALSDEQTENSVGLLLASFVTPDGGDDLFSILLSQYMTAGLDSKSEIDMVA